MCSKLQHAANFCALLCCMLYEQQCGAQPTSPNLGLRSNYGKSCSSRCPVGQAAAAWRRRRAAAAVGRCCGSGEMHSSMSATTSCSHDGTQRGSGAMCLHCSCRRRVLPPCTQRTHRPVRLHRPPTHLWTLVWCLGQAPFPACTDLILPDELDQQNAKAVQVRSQRAPLPHQLLRGCRQGRCEAGRARDRVECGQSR